MPLQFGSQYDYSKLSGEFFAINILLMIFGIVMQSFAIAYERFHMDPMKRGLVNQLITTYMAFLMCGSITRIFGFALQWLAPHIVNSFRLLGWLGWSSGFGCLITANEILFFTYWSKMWLKRVPNYNHDFLAAWLNVSNVFLAFYLGGFQAYNVIERAKNEENVPRIRITLHSSIMLGLGVLVYLIHYLIQCLKSRNANSIVPMVHEQQVFSIPIQEEPLPQLLNTMKYNPDLLNCKIALGVLGTLPPLLYSFCIHVEWKHFPIHSILGIMNCFYIPLIFCSFNPKLRSFILQNLKFR